MKIGIDGIGLLRSEYMFMDKKNAFRKRAIGLYQENANYLKGKPLTIRTLDVGNDKKVPFIEKFLSKSPNPALGLRVTRLTLPILKFLNDKFSNIKSVDSVK